MIEFLTLFLGLVAGQQAIGVRATPDVTAVEVLLDGEVAGRDSEAPWELMVDFGPMPKPSLLEAVGLGVEGDELARTAQRLNVPRATAEVRIVLAADAGRFSTAELVWGSAVGSRPRRVRAWLDGVELDCSDPKRIPLPELDLTALHLLQAEVEFSSNVAAQAQAVFGGTYADEARVDLTAIPVVSRGRRKVGQPSAMNDWFHLVDGSGSPKVVAYEKGGLDLVVVRGPGVGRAMQQLEGTIFEDATAGGVASGSGAGNSAIAGPSDLAAIANTAVATAGERLQRILALDKDQRLRILEPHARIQAGSEVEMEVFALSPEITAQQGGLYWALQLSVELPGLSPTLRLADAVAVAALQAAHGNRRRAVLLVLADDFKDQSRYDAGAIRAYMRSLGVPLHVWRIEAESDGPGDETWPAGVAIGDFRGLQRAARRLAEDLDKQRIVWLEGLHLPNAIAATERAKVDLVR